MNGRSKCPEVEVVVVQRSQWDENGSRDKCTALHCTALSVVGQTSGPVLVSTSVDGGVGPAGVAGENKATRSDATSELIGV